MRKFIYIALNEWLLLLKDKMAAVWMIVLPLAMTTIMGLVFGGFARESESPAISLPVVNHDAGELALVLLDVLSQPHNLRLETAYDDETARQMVADGSRAGAMIIPSDFSGAVMSGRRATLELVVVPGGQATPLLEGMVRGVASGFSNVQTTVDVAVREVQRFSGRFDPSMDPDQPPDYGAIADRAVAEALQALRDPPIAARVTPVGGDHRNGFDIFDQVVPGYAVMFAMFSVLGGAGAILEEKERGTFRRLLIVPLPKAALLGGKLFAHFVVGVLQIALMFGFGRLLFGVHLGHSIPGLALLTLATCWATTSLGLLLVAMIKSRKQIHSITTLVILGSSAIGGSWFPLFMMPEAVQRLARITMVAWAMEGYNRLMMLGGTLADVWLDIAVLTLYGGVCFAIGLRLFKFK